MKTSAENRFDELFKERFQDFSENPPASVLDKIKSTTSGITNPIPIWKKGGFFATVGVILISGITILLINSFSSNETVPNNNLAENKTIKTSIINIESDVEPISNVVVNSNYPTNNNLNSEKYANTETISSEINNEKVEVEEKEENPVAKNQAIPEPNTSNQQNLNIQIFSKITPATCRKSNGRVVLSSNIEKMNFYWMDVNPEEPQAIMENLHSGNYNIKAIASNGQISNFMVTIPDSSILRAGFTHYSMSDVIGVPVYFYNKTKQDGNSSGNTESISYKWYFGDGSTSTEYEPEHMYNSMGPFTASLVAVNSIGCKDSVSLPPLYISGSSIETSNVFTPNGDGINDVFKPAAEGLKSFNCTIYNTNGETIYHWNDPTQGWDGKINRGNQLASEGTYFFTMQCVGIDGKVLLKKGFIYLSLK